MTASPVSTPEHPHAHARIPDFFIVGHAKCGTTALYEMLRRHPGIYMPEYAAGAGKEPWFLARDNPQQQTSDVRDISFTGRTGYSWDDYLSLFADATPGQLVGEASSSYLWSPTAAGRIAAVRPDARIIAVFREPASFLRSLHLQLLQNRHETVTDFRAAVELDADRLENRNIPIGSYWPRALIYSHRVRYVEQLERFRAVFAPEQMLVLIYDDFRADNAGTVRQVLRFLGVDETHPIEEIKANPTIALRAARLDRFRLSLRAGSTPALRLLRDAGKALTTSRVRRMLYYSNLRRAMYGPPPAADEEFMMELRRRFKPEVVALSEYLGRDLVGLWGYEEIG